MVLFPMKAFIVIKTIMIRIYSNLQEEIHLHLHKIKFIYCLIFFSKFMLNRKRLTLINRRNTTIIIFTEVFVIEIKYIDVFNLGFPSGIILSFMEEYCIDLTHVRHGYIKFCLVNLFKILKMVWYFIET